MLTFGHVSHYAKPDSYEYDFGLIVTLNSVDPAALKSTDIFEPGSARRRRVQIPSAADLTLFDLDNDSNVLKSLTGRTKTSRAHLFKNATGASNLRISAQVTPDTLISLCEHLFDIYNSDEYKLLFPDINSVRPVGDPSKVSVLNAKLLGDIFSRSDSVSLAIPDIINYNESLFTTFTGAGSSSLYDDVNIRDFYDYIDAKGASLNILTVDDLKRFRLVLVNEDGNDRDPYPFYKSIIYDTALPGDGAVYHLTDGQWYRFDDDYIERMRAQLDPFFIVDPALIAFNHGTEGVYNQAATAPLPDSVCLDTTNISPSGNTQIEPCDIYTLDHGKALLRHVKISTHSSLLSHLFNQAVVSIEILKLEPKSSQKLMALVLAKGGAQNMLAPIQSGSFSVQFGIVTKKDPTLKSDNLPLFSRMSLLRALKSLKLYNTDRVVSLIPDMSAPKPKKTKPRKKIQQP
jgi:uncharacterized protein (TIGR04141 family)